MAKPYPLSLDNASILQRIKEGYLLWINIAVHIPKGQRYTIGSRIEHKFLGLLELAYVAYFTTDKDKKIEKVEQCILSLDVLKFLIHVAWEAKLIGHKHFADLVEKLNEVGRMLGGWKKKLENKNREC